MVQMIPVSSSMIRSVGYDSELTQLFVEFMNGTTYKYDDVPESLYDAMMSGGSVGSYFSQNIRNAYDGVQV